jgi:hypothetical protein
VAFIASVTCAARVSSTVPFSSVARVSSTV